MQIRARRVTSVAFPLAFSSHALIRTGLRTVAQHSSFLADSPITVPSLAQPSRTPVYRAYPDIRLPK